jgi:hypothetical protein
MKQGKEGDTVSCKEEGVPSIFRMFDDWTKTMFEEYSRIDRELESKFN